MRISQITGTAVFLTTCWAIWFMGRHYTNKPTNKKSGTHSIKLKYGINEFGEPRFIWDPPPTVHLFPDGGREILGEQYKKHELPRDMVSWLLLQPIEYRGITLHVEQETPLQEIVYFLDEFHEISRLVVQQSIAQLGIPGKSPVVNIYFYCDTGRRITPRTTPPPVELHTIPPPPPA